MQESLSEFVSSPLFDSMRRRRGRNVAGAKALGDSPKRHSNQWRTARRAGAEKRNQQQTKREEIKRRSRRAKRVLVFSAPFYFAVTTITSALYTKVIAATEKGRKSGKRRTRAALGN